jgi:hypothetical protein
VEIVVWLKYYQFKIAAQHRLQATRLRRLLAEGKRAQTGLLLKVLRRTRRAPEPYRYTGY